MTPGQRRHVNAQSLIFFGVGIAAINIYLVLHTARAAAVCSSALVSAFDSQCGPVTTVHDLSIVGIIAGAALIITGLIIRAASTPEGDDGPSH
jgi:hypothetical protein